MPSVRVVDCAASSLLVALLDGPERDLDEVARTRHSVHYETGDARVPVLSVGSPGAVRLPASFVAEHLPEYGPVSMGVGRLRQRSGAWRVTRWWRPRRPRGLVGPAHDLHRLRSHDFSALAVRVPGPAYDALRPEALVGRGPGLTPEGDDLVAGALVTARATADPRFRQWRAATLQALGRAGTTSAVSRALLHHACDGYATPELEDFLVAVCGGGDFEAAATRLLAVGHTSGAALMAGVVHTLDTQRLEGAA